MFKVGLMKFPDTRSCIEIVVTYHVEDHKVYIDSKSWNVYETSIPDEFIDIHSADPNFLCPHACMGGEKLCPYICPHMVFDSAKKACEHFNSINKKKITIQLIDAETNKLLRSIYKEQAKLIWNEDLKSFRNDFLNLVKKYGMDMEIVSETYGDDLSMDSILLKRSWNSLGETCSNDLIYILTSNE